MVLINLQRCFRIGQQKSVEVARFVVKDTIDTDIMMMQKRKTLEIESAMEERNRPTRLSTRELLRLFGPVKNLGQVDPEACEGGDSFIMVDDPFEKRDGDDEMEAA